MPRYAGARAAKYTWMSALGSFQGGETDGQGWAGGPPGSQLPPATPRLPPATDSAELSIYFRSFHISRSTKPGSHGAGTHVAFKAFTDPKRGLFHRKAPASPALWSGSQGCVYPKGGIRRTAATNANICAGSVAAHPHRSGHMTTRQSESPTWSGTLSRWAGLACPGACPGAGSAAAVLTSQHLSSSQRAVDALPKNTAGGDFAAPRSSDETCLDDVLPRTHLQTPTACVPPEDGPPNQMTSHG